MLRPHLALMALALAMAPGAVRAQIVLPPSFGGQQSPSGGSPNPGYGQQAGPSLAGSAWSGDTAVQNLLAHGTDFYGTDGRYVSAAQFSNGVLVRVWGQYRTSSIGNGRLLVDLQPEGSLPRQLCVQMPGHSPSCQAFDMPPPSSLVVTFTSPDSFQGFDPQKPGQAPITSRRDPNPYLLQRQVPDQEVVLAQPQPGPSAPPAGGGYAPPAPVVGGYQSPRSTGPKCDDLQQRRICNINDGRLVSSGGCLVCVN